MKNTYHAVALLSGGLDSILAARLIQDQGLRVKCLHFTSPFFGKAHKLKKWAEMYSIDPVAVDIGQEFCDMMRSDMVLGFGKRMNPCVDCKILMISKARELMEEYGASFIITGEVLGQRPMSQRRDAMNVVRRDSDTKELLLRPLCAKLMDPTPAEESGLVDRERLLDITGRGRKRQLAMAEEYGFAEIPTPAGGCLLAEKESARRYWPVFVHANPPTPGDYLLANTGRQFWAGDHWLAVGRDRRDNERLAECVRDTDLIFKLRDVPGPLMVGRQFPDRSWSDEVVRDASRFIVSFSPKARRSDGPVVITLTGDGREEDIIVDKAGSCELEWKDPRWEEAEEGLKDYRK